MEQPESTPRSFAMRQNMLSLFSNPAPSQKEGKEQHGNAIQPLGEEEKTPHALAAEGRARPERRAGLRLLRLWSAIHGRGGCGPGLASQRNARGPARNAPRRPGLRRTAGCGAKRLSYFVTILPFFARAVHPFAVVFSRCAARGAARPARRPKKEKSPKPTWFRAFGG